MKNRMVYHVAAFAFLLGITLMYISYQRTQACCGDLDNVLVDAIRSVTG